MEAAVRIGELARRTGVSPELLRAWEQRYGLLQPARSPGGFRLYSAADEGRVRRMTAQIERGLSAAEAARLALSGVEEAPVLAGQPLEDLARELGAALDRFDTTAAHRAIDRLFATVTVDVVIADVLVPLLRDLGERWAAGRATVAQEHFASNLVRGRLLGLARDWGVGEGPSALLACPPEEAHDLGLVMFGILLARRGWSVTFLGGDTPFETLEDSARMLQPSVVVLATLEADLFRRHVDGIRSLAKQVPLVVAAPVDESEVTATGARAVAGDIVQAAATLQV